jgi:methylamine dehydrogenase accessory protein MauD
VAPLGALTLPHALAPGEVVPPLIVGGFGEESIVLGGVRDSKKGQLLLFISPSCPMCKQILGLLRSFARAESRRIEIVLVGEGSSQAHAALVREHGLGDLPLVLDPKVGLAYQVGKLPYAMLIDPAGLLRSAGLINSREHLESLVVAFESGVASVQDYLRASRPPLMHDAPLVAKAAAPRVLKGDTA